MSIGKLSRRLFLLTVVALFPVAIVLFYNLYSIRLDKDAEIHLEALHAGQLASLEMQRIISGAENVLIALSAAAVVQEQDAAGCQEYLARVGAKLPQFSGFAIADVRGRVICRQKLGGVGLMLDQTVYFREAMKTGRFFVGEYSTGLISDQPALPLAMPVRSDRGDIFGVVIGALSLDWLAQRLGERDFSQRNALTIADRTGTMIARIPDPEKFVGTKIASRIIHFVNSVQPSTFTAVGRDGVNRVIGFYPTSAMSMGLFVSVGISTDEAYASIRRATWIGLLVTLASLFLSFVLAWLTTRELIRKPVGRLIATISDWRAGNEMSRTGMNERGSEFGVVGKAIDDFLAELLVARKTAAAAEQQRELLVGELDHRVKNLLATVQSVARQTFRDKAGAQDAVEIFTQRLAAMSEAHGLLMKDSWQSAGMGGVVATATRPFDNQEDAQFEIAGPDFPIKAKAVLSLSMALHEMCTNAVKYGALKSGEGRIRIDWNIENDESPDDGILRMTWTERCGPVVVEPDKSGFGLKMIERVLGYELEAEVHAAYPSSGATFTLVVPLRRIRSSTKDQS
ncbi:MAG: hypothetical protein JWM58_1210 [Rhizobium sp.]|nr:hypothetical protein [Rhizobium sp.]